MSSDDITTIVLISVLTAVIVFGILYVWISWALSRVFAKLGEDGWKAWVPILNLVVLFRLGGQNPLWLLAFAVPGLNFVGLVFEIVAIHKVNARFGKGVGFTVFAALLFPVWATVLGFGHDKPIAVAEPGSPEEVAPRPSQRVEAPAAVTPSPSTSSGNVPADVFITVPPAATVAEPAAVAEPATVAEPVEAPTSFTPSPSNSAPATPSAAESPEEATMVVQRRARAWHLVTDAGQTVTLTGQVVFVGRNPAASADAPDAQLVSLDDPDKSVSKTHARLELVGGAWQVTDLHSTNGVTLLADADAVDGDEVAPDAATPAGEYLLFGELRSRIHLSH